MKNVGDKQIKEISNELIDNNNFKFVIKTENAKRVLLQLIKKQEKMRTLSYVK